MRGLPLLLALSVAAAFLSGCAATPPATSAGSGDPGVDVAPTATTGIIKGVVVDQAIKPLVKAIVTVKAGDKTFTNVTNANGGFGFEGLEPGTYFVAASKAGFLTGQTSVEVKANEADVPTTRLTLEADATFLKPFVQPYQFKGFIECSTTTGPLGFAACSTPNDLPGCGASGVPCSVLPDNFAVQYPLTTLPMWVQSEAIWTSTQPLGNELSLMWSRDCGDDNDGFLCDYDVSGTSPLLLTGDEATVASETLQEASGENVLYIRVFNTGVAETQGVLGLTFEQSFEVYSHVFYGYVPGEWRFSDNKPVPQPLSA